MTWGPGLLDKDNLNQQAREQALLGNPWGPGLGIPTTDESAPAEGEPVADGAHAPLVIEQGLSIASVEQRLAEDPKWWEEALALEVSRANPRKGALRAILRVMREEGVDPDIIEKASAFLTTEV